MHTYTWEEPLSLSLSLWPSTYTPLNVTVQTQAKHCFVKSNEQGEPIAIWQVARWSLRTSPLEFISLKTSRGIAHRSREIYGIYFELMKENREIVITTCNRLDSETHVDFDRWCLKEFPSIIFGCKNERWWLSSPFCMPKVWSLHCHGLRYMTW